MSSLRAPAIPGWSVTLEDRTYVATRTENLTDYQRLWGAVPKVEARTDIELWVLCDAQRRLAERLALAEAAHPSSDPCPEVIPCRARQGGPTGLAASQPKSHVTRADEAWWS